MIPKLPNTIGKNILLDKIKEELKKIKEDINAIKKNINYVNFIFFTNI